MATRVARLLIALAARGLPPGRRELLRGLLAERSAVPPGRARLAWLAGGCWFWVREVVVRVLGYLVALLAGAAALVAVDRAGTSDDAGMVSMLVLLAVSGALGFAAPRLAWLAGLTVGSAIAVANLVAPSPAATQHGAPVTLFILIVPALTAAYVGVAGAWLVRGRRPSRDAE